MSINAEALEQLKADYQRATGEECREFYCPIMNEFGIGPRGLMNGHILPECIQSASRATVIQRADVDNLFGRIEAVLCTFLNRPFYDVKELYKRGNVADWGLFCTLQQVIHGLPDNGEWIRDYVWAV
jgi:hypothetical protein